MKKILAFLLVVLTLVGADTFARGGGGFSGGRSSFSSGRSSFSGGSYSSGRSSFGSGRSTTPSAPSKPSTSSGSGFTTSSRGLFGRGGSTSKGGAFTPSSRGKYGSGSSTSTYKPTTKEVLYSSSSTVSTPGQSISIYHYYYPTPFYGSGYSFYQYYFWYHMFGNHSNCYHNGGGKVVVRKCELNPKSVNMVNGKPTNTCHEGETCDPKTLECKLKQ